MTQTTLARVTMPRPPRRRPLNQARRATPKLWLEFLEDRTLLSDWTAFLADPAAYDHSSILVRFRPGTTIPAASQILSGTRIDTEIHLVPGLHPVRLSQGVRVVDALAAYQANPLVLYAEPNGRVHTADTIPNDPEFNRLWGLRNTGQVVNGQPGKPGADISAVQAWDKTTGDYSATIAVIDTGIDYDHPDLYENIWINQAEIPASRLQNLVDVDGDGLITFFDLNYKDPDTGIYVNQGPGKIIGRVAGHIDADDILAPMVRDGNGNDTGMGGWAYPGNTQDGDSDHPNDFVGWNFVSNTNRPKDDFGHGTHTSGTIGAIGNNGVGVAGVNWKAQIAAVKFLNAGGGGTWEDAARSVDFVTRHNIPISSNSWGGTGGSQALLDAIKNSRAIGHIFVAAAGNFGANNDQFDFFPANYSVLTDNVIAVAATDNRDNLAGFSDYGLTKVQLGAPGVDVYSTLPTYGSPLGQNYGYLSGTSMATPHVAGVVTLVREQHPTWTYQQIIDQLLTNVDAIASLKNRTVTGGRLNAADAVAPAAGPRVVVATPVGDLFGTLGSIRFAFSVPIDVPTFTASKVVSFKGPAGNISVTGVKVVPNTKNSQFDVTFATQSKLGIYTMVIGPDIRDVDGNQMDQDRNGIPGEIPGDQYTVKVTIQGPKIIASTPSGKLLGPVTSVRVSFNEPMDPATFTPDKVFGFKGPKGFIDITAVSPVAGSNNAQYDIKFAAQGVTGHYEMLIGPDIRDKFGHQMDQDGNFQDGEVPGDLYDLRFDLQGPRILSSTPPPSPTLFGGLSSVQVTFNVPMDPATFTPAKIALFTRTVGQTVTDLKPTLTTVTPVAGSNHTKFNINFVTTGTTGKYKMVIGPDIRDFFGNQMDQDDNLKPGEIPGDQYTAAFNLGGPKVASSKPNNTSGPVYSVRVVFNVSMDVASFTPDKITQFTGPNGDISGLFVVPVAGTSFKQFDILFPVQTTTGRYQMVLGPDILDYFGNQMDQDGNFIPGEPKDQYTANFTIPGPKVTKSDPSGTVLPGVDHVRFTFNVPIDASTFTPDKVASFTGPGGIDIPVTGVSEVPFTNHTQFDVTFDAVGPVGSYKMVIGPNIQDLYGNEMDQDGNFIPGEPKDAYTANFTLRGPLITANSPMGNLFPPVDHVRLTFNEPMDPSTFTLDKITSFSGPNGDIPVVTIVPVEGQNNTQFEVTFASQGATGHYTMVIQGVVDPFGNPSAAYTARFNLFGPRIVSSSPSRAKPGVDHVLVTFNVPMDVATFTPDKVASFTGPGGIDIPVTGVFVVPNTGNKQFVIMFDPQSAIGNYTMVIGPDIRDTFGNPMDQDNNFTPGEIPGDQYTHRIAITAGGEVFVGYFTDWNTDSTGPEASIRRAEFTPIHITNISNFDLRSVDVLLVDEWNNGGLSGDLQSRLADIQLWVQGGGIFMVHDRSTSSSFLVGAPDGRVVRNFDNGTLLNVIPPGGTLVTDGPFGKINDDTLSGGFYSNHGFAQRETLPDGTVSILSAGPDYTHVAAFSYILGGGLVYYSTIPLDFYLDGFGDPRLIDAFRTIYTPNVLVYLVTPGMSPIAPPGRPGSGESVALLFTGGPAVAALGMSSAASLGKSSASIGNGATTVLEIRNIDRFFGSTGKEDEDQVFALSRSEHVGLALAGGWKDDAVTDIFGKDSVPF